jgi:DNA-binding NarL/FixJ family response regulator
MIRILLADDHPVITKGIPALLKEATDIEIVGTASTGREAKARVETLNPDIAILDIEMPEIKGIELAQWITNHHPQVRIIAYSQHDDYEHIDAMLKAGAGGYVLKDAPIDSLLEAIREVHKGRHYYSPRVSNAIVKEKYQAESKTKGPFTPLTPREIDVLKYLSHGLENSEIATTLNIGLATVESHIKHLFEKTGKRNSKELVRFAIENGYG